LSTPQSFNIFELLIQLIQLYKTRKVLYNNNQQKEANGSGSLWVQTSVWYYLLQRGDPGETSSCLFLAPLFGVLTSWILLGEQMNEYVAIGGLLICVGVFLVNWRGKAQDRQMISMQ